MEQQQRTVAPTMNRLRVPPETYARVFEADPLGRVILEDLVARFHDCTMFDPENARKTDFKLGSREVVQFILKRIGQVNAPPQSDQDPA